MRIFIYMAGGPHWIGGVQYTRNLLRAVALLPRKEMPEVVLRIGGKNMNSGYEAEFCNCPNVTIDAPVREMTGLAVKWNHVIRKITKKFSLREPGKKVWLSDDCTVAFPIKAPDFPGPYEKVYWIPDFQYKRFPHLFSDDDRQKRDNMYGKMLEGDVILVLSSESVKDDFTRSFPSLRHVRPRVLRFYSIFTDEEYAPDPKSVGDRYGLPDTFAYLPNQFYLHKRHDTVFAALAKLKDEGIKIPLVCTGSSHDYRTQAHIAPLLKFIENNDLSSQIKILGVVPRIDQIQIFRQSSLVIQPSMSEGWSTTVEDARALGKDIILSDIEVHKEQSPEHGHFFETGNIDSLAEQLRKVWPVCRPGVQPEREHNARTQSRENGLKFARTFIEIMQEAHSIYLGKDGNAITSK
ncbi:MAG: glycosyltransferase [Nitrospirae bacterium]|nr:glycosyltransferase [Nitrospirota bacterium]